MSTGLVDKSFASNDELFYLKWNNFQKNVSTQFEKLREEDDLVDITFACEGKKLTAHKLVLFACSPFFKDLLKKNPSPHPVFFMNDVKYDVLKAILEYMYLGEVHITNENLKDFIKTAEGLQIRGLSKENNGDIVMPPSNQVPLRKDDKQDNTVENVHLLDEFCRKRPEPVDLNHALIKRVKTVDNHIATVGGQDNVNVEPKVEMVEYLDADGTNHQSPTYCSMDNFTEKSSSRNNIAHMSQLNAAGFAQTTTQPSSSGHQQQQQQQQQPQQQHVQQHEYKSEEDSSWMDKSLDNISVNSEQQNVKYKSGKSGGSRSSRSTDDKTNCLTPRCCPVCSRLYSNVSNLRQHMRLIHNPTAVCCPICQKHFNSELYLKRHYSSIHSINPNSQGDGDIVDQKPPSTQLTTQQQQPPQQQQQQQQQQQAPQQTQQQQQQQQQQQASAQQAAAPTATNTWNPYHHHDTTQLVNPFIK
ncbi:transcription factor GAGA-like isoform X2 [Topomyia yanbarensis]|uniref:transcription factor GAGA-like isoform X2 n=1 Tax=Topomyia yanbarensis TaxID=2498891 RepID=UPI00273BC33C|nr:transcription factor GAGA-like isoform X2 [Topomyia yanbarensis]XP_058839454.1 transcription factor GAGA-like isoform X2 [Topomyia yanbarensis]